MVSLVGTLRTELMQRTHLVSGLQRTKLLSRKPTQDCTLLHIGCQTFSYQLIIVCNDSFFSYFWSMFSNCCEKSQKVYKFYGFRFLIEVCCVKILLKRAETLAVFIFSSLIKEIQPSVINFHEQKISAHLTVYLSMEHIILASYKG